MAAIETSGTLSADGTEQTLATVTNGKTYVLAVDLNAMASGDTVVLRSKPTVGGNSRQFKASTYTGAQTNPIVMLEPIPAPTQVVYTLEQTAGTNRSYPWEVYDLTQ